MTFTLSISRFAPGLGSFPGCITCAHREARALQCLPFLLDYFLSRSHPCCPSSTTSITKRARLRARVSRQGSIFGIAHAY